MKKSVLLVFVFCFSFLVSYSQTLNWEWARQGNCSLTPHGNGEGWGVTVDRSENAYITGFFEDTIHFGNITFIDTMPWQGAEYLVKYDSSGNIIRAKKTRGTGSIRSDMSKNITTDKWGNLYLTGYGLEGSLIFDSYVLDSAVEYLFLTKYDSSGNVLWALAGDTSAQSRSEGVTTDALGNVYLTGYFWSRSIKFGSTILINDDTSGTKAEIFIAKYDSSGNIIWAKSVHGKKDDYGSSIATDPLSNLYITGSFISDTLIFDSDTLIKSGTINVFIAKYDSSGNVIWARNSSGTASFGQSYSVVTKSVNDLYIMGYFEYHAIAFGTFTLINASTQNNSGNTFLVKYDSSGNVLWAKSSSDTLICAPYSLDVDVADNPYISGGMSPNTFLKFDTLNLHPIPNNVDPMFIVKYNSAGQIQWGRALQSGGDDDNCIAVGTSGSVYVTGDFYGRPFVFGNDTLFVNDSTQELPFLAKLSYSGLPLANFTSSATNICAEGSNCINFTDFSVGNPTSWQWHFPGASPDTSSQQNPTQICYSSAGTYAVTLIVTNAAGSDTLTVSPMITVVSAPAPPTVTIVGDTLYSSHASSYQWYLNGGVIAGATDSFYIWHQGGTYSVGITDSVGCSSLSGGIAVGIQEIDVSGLKFEIYPNPVSQTLVISHWSLGGKVTVAIYNVFGEKVYGAQLQTLNSKLQTVLDVSSLSNGVYFLKIEYEGAAVNRKFVVVKK